MRCDMQPTGEKSPAGTPLYQCSREGCRQGPWPSPTGRFSATCRSAGLGDAAAAVIKATTGLKTEDCQQCMDRRDAMNNWGARVASTFTRTE